MISEEFDERLAEPYYLKAGIKGLQAAKTCENTYKAVTSDTASNHPETAEQIQKE